MRAVYATERQFSTQADVRNYIARQARENNIPVFRALFIAEHESGFGWRDGYYNPAVKGDGGCSIGIFQINTCVHKDITRKQAANLKLAMEWAIPHLRTEPEIWSVWRNRFDWFSYEFAKELALK